MNRVINDPDQVVEDMLRGILVAHPELRQYESNPRVIVKAKPSAQGRVGIVTGGGSGHEPAFLGYVGPGLVDAVAVGEIFPRPPPKAFSTPSAPPTMAQAWHACMATTRATT